MTAVVECPAQETAQLPRQRATKVLHIVNGEFYAGAERVQDLLALNLPSTGFEVGFAAVKPGAFAANRQSDVSVVEIPFRHPWQRNSTRELVRLVNSEGYQLVHSHTPRSAWAALAVSKSTGVPAVHTMHDVFLGMHRNLGRRIFNAYTTRQLRQFEFVTTVSPESQRLADRLGLGSRRTMIRNGVPHAADLPTKSRPTSWNIGCVGLIRPCKGVEVLIQAIGELKRRHHSVRATLVGTFDTPEYEREVRGLIDRLELNQDIVLTGFTRDVPGQLRTFDLFAMPSVGPEGLPMVLLEAMAHALPTIGSDVPGVGDTIRNEIDGLIFPSGDFVAMADRIEDVITGKRDWDAMGAAARQRHRDEFSAERMAYEFAKVYSKVLGTC